MKGKKDPERGGRIVLPVKRVEKLFTQMFLGVEKERDEFVRVLAINHIRRGCKGVLG